MNFFLSDLRSEELRRWLIRRLEIEEQRRIRANEVIGNTIRREIIEKNLQFLAFALTLGVIRRIASCISTDKIIDVNDDLSQEKATPAYALINTLLRLRHCPIDIPRIRKLRESFDTEKNRWAGQTLSIYLQNYLNTHRIEQRVRQQMCSLLGIKYFPNRG